MVSIKRDESGCRRDMVMLFLLAMLSYAYFLNGPVNVNTVPRLALTLSLIDRGSLTIDEFAPKTIDKAYYNGHYYSDKAPGMSFLALPPVFAAVQAARLAGVPVQWLRDGELTFQFRLIAYLATVFASGLPTALAAVALYRSARGLGASSSGGLFAALAFALGTPAWGWATAFFGHATSGSLQFLALAAILRLAEETAAGPGPARRRLLLGAAAGFLLGASTMVEFTAAPSAALIALYGLWRLRPRQSAPRPALAGTLLAGGIAAAAALAPLLLYNTLAFGSPLALGYGHVSGFEGMHQNFFGIGLPQGPVLFSLLFSESRGLLWIAPVLLLVPWGLYRLLRGREQAALGLLIAAIILYYLCLNAGYYYWDGGYSTGPRHVTPMLSFACLPLALLWTGAPTARRVALGALLGLSILLSLLCVSVGMMAPLDARLLRDFLVPHALAGNLPTVVFRLFVPPMGPLLLLPLLLAWGGLAILWRRRSGPAAGSAAATALGSH